jgi:hypothetical protein
VRADVQAFIFKQAEGNPFYVVATKFSNH